MHRAWPILLLALAVPGCGGDEGAELHDEGARTTTTPSAECREVAGEAETGRTACKAVEVNGGG